MDEKKVAHDDTPTRNTKSRSWCFTWNNFTADSIEYLLTNLSKNSLFVFGEEIGTNGTSHLQGAVKFKNARSFKSVRKLFKENHVEQCKNWQASINYCSKDGQIYTNIETEKSRKDMIFDAYYKDVVWRKWQQQVVTICESEPDSRTIHWIWESNGNAGKSFLCKYLWVKYDAIVADGKKDNIFNQIKIWLDTNKKNSNPRVVILDVPRKNIEYVNYQAIEQIKNGFIYSGKYEGGICAYKHPHVFIFANEEPNYSAWSKDRYSVLAI